MFQSVSSDYICKIVQHTPAKHCVLDPVPTYIVKEVIDCLAPYIAVLINTSLAEAYIPTSQKMAVIIPRLKKIHLNPKEES